MKTSNRNTIQKKNDSLKIDAEIMKSQIRKNIKSNTKGFVARLKCPDLIAESKFIEQDPHNEEWLIIDDHSKVVLCSCYSKEWAFAKAESITNLGLDVYVVKTEKIWYPLPFRQGDHLSPAPEVLE